MNEAREFWSGMATRLSWEKLLELNKKFKIMVIGGWAAFLWTKTHKSKDIDVIVDYEELQKLASEYRLEKNERLKKYEVKMEQFDVDVYLPKFSKLALPVEEVIKHKAKIDGITTVECEVLVILKQGAEIARRGSIKGRKDAIDLLTLLIRAPFDCGKYAQLLERHGLEGYWKELAGVVKKFSREDLQFVGMNEYEFSKWKKEFLTKCRHVR